MKYVTKAVVLKFNFSFQNLSSFDFLGTELVNKYAICLYYYKFVFHNNSIHYK
jgi:FAD synthase